jgi:two-component system OmpR family sensor kinase
VVKAATEQLDKLAKGKHMSINTDIQTAKVIGHIDSLTQLIAIVLENALKYGPENSNVYLYGSQQAGHYNLTVRDEGPGIASSDLPHIFERLYRGDKARSSKVGGYGLGLSLAREIARANRGSIEADNYPSGGAVFTIELNLAS